MLKNFLLTANQRQYVICVFIKTGIIINKDDVFASNIIQNLAMICISGGWSNGNDDYSDTFSLKKKPTA